MTFMSLNIILLALGMMSIVTLDTSSNFVITRLQETLSATDVFTLDVRLLVIVNTPAGVTIPFEVLSCNDVLSLKRMIAIETDIPVANQTLLILSDHMTVLENTKPVSAYVGDNRLTLDCMVLPVHFIRAGPPKYPEWIAWEIRAVPQNNAAKNEPWKPMNILLAKSSVTLLIKVQFVLVLVLVLCCSVVN